MAAIRMKSTVHSVSKMASIRLLCSDTSIGNTKNNKNLSFNGTTTSNMKKWE
jgi:hypothetical protein